MLRFFFQLRPPPPPLRLHLSALLCTALPDTFRTKRNGKSHALIRFGVCEVFGVHPRELESVGVHLSHVLIVGGIASLVRSIVTRSVVDEPEMDRLLSGQRKTSGRVFLHLSGSSPEVPVVFRSGGVPLMFTHLSVLHLCMILEMMLRTRRREGPPGGESSASAACVGCVRLP